MKEQLKSKITIEQGDITKVCWAVARWLEEHPETEMQVIFCCFDARTANTYRAKL